MQELDPDVREAISAWLEANPSLSRRADVGALTLSYVAGQSSTAVDVGAYLVARLPATLAAVRFVFNEVRKIAPALAPASFLDVGAGPGTASLAALSAWPSLQAFALVEADARFAAAAEAIAVPHLPSARVFRSRLQDLISHADMVTAAYVLAEMPMADIGAAALKLWRASQQALVIVEPGTPQGFARVRAARDALLAAGAYLIGPCPHSRACPVAGGDWCHFKVQLARSRAHLHAKGASVPFEHEALSWLAVGRAPMVLPAGRVVAAPRVNKVAVQLRVCAHEGLAVRMVAARDKANYKAARKLKWGDALA